MNENPSRLDAVYGAISIFTVTGIYVRCCVASRCQLLNFLFGDIQEAKTAFFNEKNIRVRI